MYTPIPTMENSHNDNSNVPIIKDLQEELDSLPKFSPECCIYTVPRHLQSANEGVYTPLIISIGPLHHHHHHLHHTQVHKLKYLKSFLDRSGQNLAAFLQIVRHHEAEIRGHYADPMVAQMDPKELTKIVLVDAAFLIELFRRRYEPKLIVGDDQMFKPPRMVVEVSHDIRLEENQLPFFILCKLYDKAVSNATSDSRQQPPSFIHIARIFLDISREPAPDLLPENSRTYKHFVDLLRHDLLPSHRRLTVKPSSIEVDIQSGSNCCPWIRGVRRKKPNTIVQVEVHSGTHSVGRNEDYRSTEKPDTETPHNDKVIACKTATALHEAGVKFIKCMNDDKTTRRSLDIEFNLAEGMLSIPPLVVQDDTEALLKNLAFFEQCHYFDDSYIIDYILFLDFLINTAEDVRLLVREGIIENLLGSEERVAELFNGLSKHLRLRSGSYYYAEQTRELNEYYNRSWNRHLAVLRQKYFNHPWATISVVYAVVLLLLTVLQAVTGLISIFPPKR